MRSTDRITDIASKMPGISLTQAPNDKPWFHLLNKDVAEIDLIYTELGRDVANGRSEGTLLDIASYYPSMKASNKVWPAFSEKEKTRCFIPSTLYVWGLFYNKELLDSLGIKYPGSFGAMEKTFADLAAKNIVPIALGSKNDWSVFAWFAYLDIRTNGYAAHQNLLDGKRAFDDPSLTQVYATLQKWRDNGWIDRDSSSKNWSEALQDVQSGKSAFSLMGAFAANRFPAPEKIRWARVPSGGAKEGELAVIQGFAVSAKAEKPSAAVALADAFISASSPGLVDDSYSIPSIVTVYKQEKGKDDVLSTIKAEQAAILRDTKDILPQMDRYLPAQASYEMLTSFRSFFDKKSQMNASDLANALKAIKF
jgi:ABC-type glycerol-3-phosphate transport system substrate-binding protein